MQIKFPDKSPKVPTEFRIGLRNSLFLLLWFFSDAYSAPPKDQFVVPPVRNSRIKKSPCQQNGNKDPARCPFQGSGSPFLQFRKQAFAESYILLQADLCPFFPKNIVPVELSPYFYKILFFISSCLKYSHWAAKTSF